MVKISIFLLGLFMILGSLGTLDVDPNADILLQITMSVIGLVMMFGASLDWRA